ncbi:MAG TPA: lysophospholipid acyltransferase family protein [Solirubrobacteraceae bacterium]|jgi:1-acyl-sn-glycerol-3-phosphate acyltransferase|nr:lysophospholipid acyltransferase family protein [Solirubrobacteraceae bacterium]
MQHDHDDVPGLNDAPAKPEVREHAAAPAANLDDFRERSLHRGVNPLIYWTLRALLVPAFLIYLRMQRVGREHLPKSGPLLLASNHRSFLDPFVIGTLVRRPVYYFAKRELFEKRWQAWILNALGAFPVDRGAGDRAALDTARAILERGDCVVLFPEGTRIRKGPLSTPRRGIGRLALESGVPVVPIAVRGSEHVRRGCRIRPRKVCLRVGRPLSFPTTGTSSPALATAVTDRVWACVSLQWEWLGGERASQAVGERSAPQPARSEARPQTSDAPAVRARGERRAPTTFVRESEREQALPSGDHEPADSPTSGESRGGEVRAA